MSEDSQRSKPQSCPMRPLSGWWGSPHDVRCPIILRKAWPFTIVGNMFWECHAPYTLKASLCWFRKKSRGIVPFAKDKMLWSIANSPYFASDGPTSLNRLTIPFTHFYIFAYRGFVLNIDEILLGNWTISNNQSINIFKINPHLQWMF